MPAGHYHFPKFFQNFDTTVTNSEYHGAVVLHHGSRPEVLSRIEQATADLTKLGSVWRDNNNNNL